MEKTRWWVSLTKYAGASVEADTAEEARQIVEDMDESQYELPQTEDGWQIFNIEVEA